MYWLGVHWLHERPYNGGVQLWIESIPLAAIHSAVPGRVMTSRSPGAYSSGRVTRKLRAPTGTRVSFTS